MEADIKRIKRFWGDERANELVEKQNELQHKLFHLLRGMSTKQRDLYEIRAFYCSDGGGVRLSPVLRSYSPRYYIHPDDPLLVEYLSK